MRSCGRFGSWATPPNQPKALAAMRVSARTIAGDVVASVDTSPAQPEQDLLMLERGIRPGPPDEPAAMKDGLRDQAHECRTFSDGYLVVREADTVHVAGLAGSSLSL